MLELIRLAYVCKICKSICTVVVGHQVKGGNHKWKMIYRMNGQTSFGCLHLYTSQFQIIMTTSIYNVIVYCWQNMILTGIGKTWRPIYLSWTLRACMCSLVWPEDHYKG